MYKGKTVAVVIPAYNEEGLVGEVIDTVPSFVDRVYVVDDASTDGTWVEIKRRASLINQAHAQVESAQEPDSSTDRPPVRARAARDGGAGQSAVAGDGGAGQSAVAGDGGAGQSPPSPNREAGQSPVFGATVSVQADDEDHTSIQRQRDGGESGSVQSQSEDGESGSVQSQSEDGESGSVQSQSEDGESGSVQSDGGQELRRRVVPIRHETNRGVGAAIKTGYRRVLRNGIDVAAVMNGDGQMDPDILDRILDPVVEGTADYAKGNRLPTTGNMPALRQFGNVVLTLLTKVASGYWDLLDSQNGYTAISREALDRLDVENAYDSYGFLNDMLVRLNARDMRVVDVPMEGRYGEETSDIEFAQFVPAMSVLLLSRFLWRLEEKHLVTSFPAVMYPVGILGMVTGSGGLLVYLWSLLAAASGSGSGLGSGGGVATLARASPFVFGLGCLTVILALLIELRRANQGGTEGVRSYG